MGSPCACYDFRYSCVESLTPECLIKCFKKIAKKFVFQQEKSDTGYVHYQGRMSLVKKRRKMEALPLFGDIPPQYFEPTTNKEFTSGSMFYAMKEDTRMAGPWKDDDEEVYIPRQVREMGALRPFQLSICENAEVWDTRTINMVYCQHGNIGKSRLVQYCRAYKIGRALPPVNDYKDLLRMVCDLPTSKMYLFDMPRSLNKDRLYQFFSAIETIKDGYAYDDRYSFKEKVFDCPNIWIFSNTLPDLNMLSADRWKIWNVNKNYELQLQ